MAFPPDPIVPDRGDQATDGVAAGNQAARQNWLEPAGRGLNRSGANEPGNGPRPLGASFCAPHFLNIVLAMRTSLAVVGKAESELASINSVSVTAPNRHLASTNLERNLLLTEDAPKRGAAVSLLEYKRKRHFAKTPEPAGKEAPSGGRSFVIQKHHASHLHYDFRLELDGVLKSWAVPKGPSLDPAVKRLAMHVEDHPVEYGAFEGIIPKGEYGGGTVMLWDRGEWTPVGDPDESYRKGRLKFSLQGEKLRGAWMLIRTGGGQGSKRDERQWLLFKEKDRFAKSGKSANIVETEPLSVDTGRNLEEIAADRDWVWKANAKTNGRSNAQRTAAQPTKKRRTPPRHNPDAPDGETSLSYRRPTRDPCERSAFRRRMAP